MATAPTEPVDGAPSTTVRAHAGSHEEARAGRRLSTIVKMEVLTNAFPDSAVVYQAGGRSIFDGVSHRLIDSDLARGFATTPLSGYHIAQFHNLPG